MADTEHISLRIEKELMVEIRADAARLKTSVNWVISRRLENSRTLPPLYGIDQETGRVSIITEDGWQSEKKTIIPEVREVGSENRSAGIKSGGDRRKAGYIRAQANAEVGAVKFQGSGKCPHGYVNWMVCRNVGGGCE